MTLTTVFRYLNPLLFLLALFSVALTLYCCTQYYTYLPTSDTWAYAEFLAHAAQGHLDTAQLFERHNGLHVIALPKLVYFFDMWLTRGSGAFTVAVSLLAMLATATMFVCVIVRDRALEKSEKIFFALFCTTLLLSACQVESLLNPANLQWSLLVFSATLTAWFATAYERAKQMNMSPIPSLVGMVTGIVCTGLTSASAFLVIVPLMLVRMSKRMIARSELALLVVFTVSAMLILHLSFAMLGALLAHATLFVADFMVPPIERFGIPVVSLVVAIFTTFALQRTYRQLAWPVRNGQLFFILLLLFALVTIVATAVVRSYSEDAFTFRFVNIGLLFAAALTPLLWMNENRKAFVLVASIGYVVLLSFVNVKEASDFAWGRNHIKLTQVAHALDINDPFVVASMPGSSFAQEDFEAVQARKHFLHDAQAGIYSSDAFRHVGLSIDTVGLPSKAVCTTAIIKMRRLLPDQAAWRLAGESTTADGVAISHVYFADEKNIIRGFAIPVVPEKNILGNLFKPNQWAGLVNLDASATQDALTLYGYNGHLLCEGERIALPAYVPSVKVNRYER